MSHEEIEFKFLVKYLPQTLPAGVELTQAYLPTPDGSTKRIRKHASATTETKYYLTVKSNGLIGRNEIEKEISAQDFESFWSEKKPGQVRKQRYTIPLPANTYSLLFAEFDEYFDHLQGLLTVEVEVPAVTMRPLILSALKKTFGYGETDIIDVTEDARYKNSNLTTVNIDRIKRF